MGGIEDYIKWRGDLTFEQSAFNEVDNLVLSQIAYVDFKNIIPAAGSKEKITLRQAAHDFFDLNDEEELQKVTSFIREAPFFMRIAAESRRFGDIVLSDYADVTDDHEEKQFAAFCAELPDDTYYIAFRGTDDTIIGWKEDFNMGVMMPVPSQLEAVEYVNTVMRWKRGKLRLGGHSKGGNLAIYAAVFAKPSIQRKVVKVYNNDGPGFTKEMIESEAYRKMLPQIQTIVPQHSLVGMLLWQEEEYLVVCSSQTGIMQHDAMSWQVEGKCFVTCPSLSANSKNFHEAITSWLEGLSAKEREKFVDTLFELITASGAKTLSDINADILRSANATIKMFGTLDAGTKGHLDCFCLTVCKCIPHYLFYLISTNSQCSFSFSRINQAIFIDNHSVFLRMLFPPPWYFFHSPYDFQIRKLFEYNFLRFFASTKCIGKNLLHSFRNNDRLQ